MEDQNGMRTISAAVIQLAENPYPPEAFHRGDYHRLRAGIAGVPLNTPWVFSNGIASMEGGGREYLDGEGLAQDATDLNKRVLVALSEAMEILLDRVNKVIADIQQERRTRKAQH
jgi:hypothetical protein